MVRSLLEQSLLVSHTENFSSELQAAVLSRKRFDKLVHKLVRYFYSDIVHACVVSFHGQSVKFIILIGCVHRCSSHNHTENSRHQRNGAWFLLFEYKTIYLVFRSITTRKGQMKWLRDLQAKKNLFPHNTL
jgi:hypothetical protein